jgi:hypothetical protein
MSLRRQLVVAGGCTRALITHPFTLVYPALTAASVMGTLGLFGFLALSMGTPLGLSLPSSTVAWGGLLGTFVVLTFVGLPLLITTFKVAYCYEIHELYQGRRPLPGEGLVVAARNSKKILLGTLIIGGVFHGGRAVSGVAGPVGDAAGTATIAGSQVLSVFMAPAIAIEDAGAKATAQYVREAVGERWAGAFAATYGVNKISGAWFLLGLASGIDIVASLYLGAFPLDLPASTVLLLGVAAPVLGFFLAVSTTAFASGPIHTALYVHAVDGETPDRIGLSVDQMAKLT